MDAGLPLDSPESHQRGPLDRGPRGQPVFSSILGSHRAEEAPRRGIFKTLFLLAQTRKGAAGQVGGLPAVPGPHCPAPPAMPAGSRHGFLLRRALERERSVRGPGLGCAERAPGLQEVLPPHWALPVNLAAAWSPAEAASPGGSADPEAGDPSTERHPAGTRYTPGSAPSLTLTLVPLLDLV
ncbi:hypothetical protein H1C71_035020 [Ictidomys tridecemlineatus]|nr:hypothetical protein H1C71_035020 [Ictidomys tridecemlineatus]